MAEANNVFISWSGPRSKKAAEALREWLPTVLQAARPWMSDSDIDKGSRGLDEVARALEGMKVGIICLTPENLSAEWILYEAGALSKTLDAKTRVCTYLLAGLQPQEVKAPLGMFQWTKAEKDDTRKLVHTINKSLEVVLQERVVDRGFDRMWADLDRELASLPKPTGTPPKRPVEEMVAEILELSRTMAPEVGAIATETAFGRRRREFEQAMRTAMGGVNLSSGTVVAYSGTAGDFGVDAVISGAKMSDMARPFGIDTNTVQTSAAEKGDETKSDGNSAFYGEIPAPPPRRPKRRRSRGDS